MPTPRETPLVLVADVVDGRVLNVFPAEEVTYENTVDEDTGEHCVNRDMDIPARAFNVAEKNKAETGHETVVALTVRRYK